MTADYTAVRRLGGQIAKRMAEQNDVEGAKALQNLLRKRGVPLQASGYAEALPRDAGSRLPLIEGAGSNTSALIFLFYYRSAPVLVRLVCQQSDL